MMTRIMFGMCSTIARVCLITTTPQTLRHCMSTRHYVTLLEMTFWACRTGLPGLLVGGFASADESEEEDEADEDSNGALHIL